MQIRHAITVRGAREEIERRWHEQHPDEQWDVRFDDAPGDRGTEIHLSFEQWASATPSAS